MVEDALVVGAGPGGLAAAIQLRRYKLGVRIYESNRAGGLLWNANRVENYPGFPGGLAGPALVRIFLEQARRAGVEITAGEVTSLTWQDDLFRANTTEGEIWARAVVVASGTRPIQLMGFTISAALEAHVSYEVADLLEMSGKRVLIVGGGDAAFDYGLTLAEKNSVIIVNRNEQAKCLPVLWDKVQACNPID